MKKSLMKLSAAAILAVIALVVSVVATFAWYTVSTKGEVGGMQLNIGGSHTIQIAADVAVTTEDGVVHYPAVFSDSIHFSTIPSYDYLKEIVSLTPVSTADGIHWFFPADEDAKGDNVLSGYWMDDTYSYANLSRLPADDSVHGSYVMLDFWVVSPSDCSLRVSYGEGGNGTYVVGLPYPEKGADGTYKMDAPDPLLPACVRVGFLADTRTADGASLRAYMDSTAFDDRVFRLKGVYGEAGEEWDYMSSPFTIFEPSADVHSGESVYSQTPNGSIYRPCLDGTYVKTYPMGYVDGQAQPVDMTHRTTVQTATQWLAEGDSLLIQQLFATYMLGESQDADAGDLFSEFCSKYLGYRCDSYIEKGALIQQTDALQQICGADGTTSVGDFDALLRAGATDDVVIVELEQNVPQRIRMFVWVEGQDVDCANVIASSGLMINLELAGSSR